MRIKRQFFFVLVSVQNYIALFDVTFYGAAEEIEHTDTGNGIIYIHNFCVI